MGLHASRRNIFFLDYRGVVWANGSLEFNFICKYEKTLPSKSSQGLGGADSSAENYTTVVTNEIQAVCASGCPPRRNRTGEK